MKILSIIPARGGSKSVPRKNIAPIAGKPLIYHTISEALKVEQIDDLVVSTEDPEIADISKSLGAQVPFLRPAELASDQAQAHPVLKHCLEFMEKKREITYDAVLMLQPTSPLRTSSHIITALNLMEQNECDSVVSVVSVGGEHPFRMKRLIGNRVINYIEQGFEDMRPRQVLPKVFIRNGAIYLSKQKLIAAKNTIVGENCLGFEMSADESINIDTRHDFMLAELLLKEAKQQ